MKKTSIAVVVAIAAIAAGAYAGTKKAAAPAAGPSCGQMTADKAVLPAKFAETMTALAESLDAHAAFIGATKTKEATAEADGLKKIAQDHRDLATTLTKTADDMKAAASWTAVAHDMNKMMADPKIKETMTKSLALQKEMVALMQANITAMENMAPKTN